MVEKPTNFLACDVFYVDDQIQERKSRLKTRSTIRRNFQSITMLIMNDPVDIGVVMSLIERQDYLKNGHISAMIYLSITSVGDGAIIRTFFDPSNSDLSGWIDGPLVHQVFFQE